MSILIFCFCVITPDSQAGLSNIVPSNGQQPENIQKEVDKELPPATLVEINTHLNDLPKKLIDLKKILAASDDVEAIHDELPEIKKSIEKLSRLVNGKTSPPVLSYPQLAEIAAGIDAIHRQLRSLQNKTNDSLESLDKQEKYWQEEKENLETWKKQTRQDGSAQLLFQQKSKLFTTVKKALQELRHSITAIITLSRKIGELDVQVYTLKTKVEILIDNARAVHLKQTSPSILSADFYDGLNRDMLRDFLQNIASSIKSQVQYIRTRAPWETGGITLIILLCLGVYNTRRLVEPTNHWYPFSQMPMATSLFLALTLFVLITMILDDRHLMVEVKNTLSIIVILTLLRLSGILVNKQFCHSQLYPVTLVLILSLVLQILHAPAILVHLYIFTVSILAVIWSGYNSISKRKKLSIGNRFFFLLAGLWALIIVFSEIAGYSSNAFYLFNSFLHSVIAALVFWFLFLITQGLLELILFRVPLRILKKNSNVLVKYSKPALIVFYSLFFILVALVIWQIYPTINDAAINLVNLDFSMGGFTVTPGYILTVSLIIYGSFLISKMLQALLRQEVLPRYGVGTGVQLSITRLVHYAVLVTGGIILLRVLGVELSKLAILGGALGVGIGFGLQAIVNNFASGLILLFERPLKVGDIVQVGTEMVGEVKNLGLRATVVRTLDNADIVIPNSDLITGQVTNWTLGDRNIRVKIPVGVAYGSDIAKVFEILLRSAEENPMVLTRPSPKALFLAFGASSLDFELRVWISEFSDRRQVLSEINQEIESEFADAAIEIPFPQADLHLRSIDNQALHELKETAVVNLSSKANS